MKRLTLLLVIASLASVASANCGNGNDNGNGNGCSGNTGPQGPAGPTGQNGSNGTNGLNGANGSNGTNGVNGANGTAGKDGANGKDAQVNRHFAESNLVLDTAVRLYDGKRIQLQAFNVYALGRHQGDDIFGDGHNMQYGMRVVVKLGKSYEERRIEELERKLGLLSR